MRDEFELKNIGDLLSFYYDEVRFCDFSITRIPYWFDDDMDIACPLFSKLRVQGRLETSLRHAESFAVHTFNPLPNLLVEPLFFRLITHGNPPYRDKVNAVRLGL